MKLSQIEQIIEVADVGTISQAAANLFISQPNLSLSIKNAENELGVKLFTRTSSGVSLTQQGVEFVDRAKEILMQVDALEDACRQHNLPLRFELQIASVGYRIVDIEVAKLIQQYSSNYISVDMMDSSGIKLLDYVADNRAEIGFCTVYDFTKQVMLRQMSIRQLEYHTLCKTVSGIYVGTNNKRFEKNEKTVDLEKYHSFRWSVFPNVSLMPTQLLISYKRNTVCLWGHITRSRSGILVCFAIWSIWWTAMQSLLISMSLIER